MTICVCAQVCQGLTAKLCAKLKRLGDPQHAVVWRGVSWGLWNAEQ
jgi:hypothetical protein